MNSVLLISQNCKRGFKDKKNYCYHLWMTPLPSGRGGLLSVAESDDMRFRRASLTLEVGQQQQQQQQPCGGEGRGKGADVEGKGEGAPQSSMAGVALSTAAPSVSGTSHREPISRHLS